MTGKTSITFLRDHEVQDEHAGTDKATVFRAEKSYSVTPDTARHFVTRGIAVDTAHVKAEAEAKAKAEAEAKAKAEADAKVKAEAIGGKPVA